jgi:hypothetical protein
MKVWVEKKNIQGRDDRLQREPILGKALWSATRSSNGADIYSAMREVAPNDIVLHLTDNYGITGISLVAEKFVETDSAEHSNSSGPSYKVLLKDFKALDHTITKDELLCEEHKDQLDTIRNKGKVFYNKTLRLNEGAYLTESPLDLTKLINSIYKVKTGQELPYIQDILNATNGHANSADDKKWEELKAAVVKINDREAVEKFFDAAGHVLRKLGLSSTDQLVYAAALTKPQRIQLTIGSRYVTNIQNQGKNVILGYYVLADQVESLKLKYPELKLGNMAGGSKDMHLQWVYIEANKADINEFLEAIIVPAEDSKRRQKVSQHRVQFNHLHNNWIIEAAKDPEVRSRLFESTAHFLVGAYWEGFDPIDQTSRFVEQGIWENGYDDKYMEEVNKVPVGSFIAIKSVFTRTKTQGVMAIKAIGKVKANPKDGKRLEVEWEKGFMPFEVDFTGGYLHTISKVSNPDHIQKIWHNTPKEQQLMKFPLNTIFYGPPGTGKTYTTLLRAAQIIEERPVENYDEAMRIFNKNLGDRIEFITFHQNYSYEDFIQGLRPDTDNGAELSFRKVDGVFKRIADRALHNLRLSEKAPEEVSRELLFEQALERFIDTVQEIEENYKINDTAYIFEVEEEAFRYTGEKWKNHANGLRMKFSDLREFDRNKVSSRQDVKKLKTISGLANQHATYYFKVYQLILKHIPQTLDAPAKVKKQNYVIVIDEINRANISRVFGELITLIEPDKRSHGAIPLRCTLPSAEEFIVPSNLYIIGTMNTADKSIALLDIALRRRFEFEAMYPKYQFNGVELQDKEVLEKINRKIVELKGHDFQIGHAYFMEKSDSLLNKMNKKVIPLLLEYFMNDDKEVKGILQHAGMEVDDTAWPLEIKGNRD